MAESNYDSTDDLHLKVPIPGEKNRYARILNLTEHSSNGMNAFEVRMIGPDGEAFERKHHQVLQQVQHSHGLGPQNDDELNEYLGGMSFEEKYPYRPVMEQQYARKISEWELQFGDIESELWPGIGAMVLGRSPMAVVMISVAAVGAGDALDAFPFALLRISF